MKKAFTIGELLVTLAIIGTVAVLVLPGFIQNYQHKLYVTRLKKTIGMVEQAVTQACLDSGVQYFYQTPYNSYQKDSNTGESYQKAFLDKYFKAKTETTFPFADKYGTLNNDKPASIYTAATKTYGNWVRFPDGQTMSLLCNGTLCIILLDVNGKAKPNIGGRDLFRFYIEPLTNQVVDQYKSSTCGGVDTDDDKDRLSTTNVNTYGQGCINRIISDNWEMKY